jgi:hypothetical protein
VIAVIFFAAGAALVTAFFLATFFLVAAFLTGVIR